MDSFTQWILSFYLAAKWQEKKELKASVKH